MLADSTTGLSEQSSPQLQIVSITHIAANSFAHPFLMFYTLLLCAFKNEHPLRSRKRAPFVVLIVYIFATFATNFQIIADIVLTYGYWKHPLYDSYFNYYRPFTTRIIALISLSGLNVMSILVLVQYLRHYILNEMTLHLFREFQNRTSVKVRNRESAMNGNKIHKNRCFALILSDRLVIWMVVPVLLFSLSLSIMFILLYLWNSDIGLLFSNIVITGCDVWFLIVGMILLICLFIDLRRSCTDKDYIKLHDRFSLYNFFVQSDRNCFRCEIILILAFFIPTLLIPIADIVTLYYPILHGFLRNIYNGLIMYVMAVVFTTVGGGLALCITISRYLSHKMNNWKQNSPSSSSPSSSSASTQLSGTATNSFLCSSSSSSSSSLFAKKKDMECGEKEGECKEVLNSHRKSDVSKKEFHQEVQETAGVVLDDVVKQILELLKDRIGNQLFFTFTASEFSSENITLWRQIQTYKKLLLGDAYDHSLILSSVESSVVAHNMEQKTPKEIQAIVDLATFLYEQYIKKNATYEIQGISNKIRKGIEQQLHGNISFDLFHEVESQLLVNLKESFFRLRNTKAYHDYLKHKKVISSHQSIQLVIDQQEKVSNTREIKNI